MKADRHTAPRVSELNSLILPNVNETELANGIRLVMFNGGDEAVNRISVVWDCGKADVENPAALTLLPSMLSEGTINRSGSEIAEALDYNGAWFRQDVAQHSLTLTMHSLNHTAEAVIPLLAEMITQPTFPETTLDTIRRKQASAIELSRRKIQVRVAELSNRLSFGEMHPFSRIILPDDILNVNRNDLDAIHHRFMLGVRPTVYLTGQLTDSLINTVSRELGGIPFSESRDIIVRRIIPPSSIGNSLQSVDKIEDSLQTAVKLTIPTISRTHPDYEPLRYVCVLFGGYFGSRLMRNIREEKGYTYGISAALTGLREGSFISVTCQCDNSYVAPALEEIKHEIDKLSSEPVSSDEIAIVKRTVMSAMASVLDSPFSIMDYHTTLCSLGLPTSHFISQQSALQMLSADQIADLATKYLQNAYQIVALAGNPQ